MTNHHGEQVVMDERFWDEMYAESAQRFSGNPNGVLVTEVTGMPPGQALDVGCGEGGDAIWLARRGWWVTGLDISRVALERAATAAKAAGPVEPAGTGESDRSVVDSEPRAERGMVGPNPVPGVDGERSTVSGVAERIEWLHGDLGNTALPSGAFDLVTVQYVPIPVRPESAVRGLLDAVAPGGTLLIGSHDLADVPPEHQHGFDRDTYYQPDRIADLLDDGWTVQVNETRPRTAPAPEGTRHVNDIVLRAQRIR